MNDKLNLIIGKAKPSPLRSKLAELAENPGRRVSPASWLARHDSVDTIQIGISGDKITSYWEPGTRAVSYLTNSRVKLGGSYREFRHLVFIASDDDTFVTWDADMNTLIIYTAAE